MNAICICFVGVITVLFLSASVVDGKDPESFSIEASQGGLFVSGHAWKIQVDVEGRASLTVFSNKTVERDFKIPSNKLSEFKACLTEEKFFDLPQEVGRAVPDIGTRKLLVKQGGKERAIVINYLHKDGLKGDELISARRAARVWASLRGLFDDNDAFDIRPHEKDIRK